MLTRNRKPYDWGVNKERDAKRHTVSTFDTFRGVHLEEPHVMAKSGFLREAMWLVLLYCDEIVTFDKNFCCDLLLMKYHLARVRSVTYVDEIVSVIERCVERGAFEILKHFFTYLDGLLVMSPLGSSSVDYDKRLLLRKVDTKCYLLAKQHGFYDPELEKRIVLMQRLWRKQPAVLEPYAGPTPEEYGLPKGMDISEKYWGYRHTIYLARWNRHKRYQIVARITDEWWGDCRYQGYVDFVEGGKDIERVK